MPSDRYPSGQANFLAFCRARADQWVGGQGGTPPIGITSVQSAEFDAAVTAAEAKMAIHIAAIGAARSARVEKDTSYTAMTELFGGLVSTIESFAKVTGDPDVYALAGIPEPKTPGPRQAPPTPGAVDTDLRNDGAILFTFECTTGGGAQFEIQRQDTPLGAGEPSAWNTLALVGEKQYLDEAVPVGMRRVDYRVRATLSTGATSPWSTPAPANFGIGGSGTGAAAAAA